MAAVLLSACAPTVRPVGDPQTPIALTADHFRAADGAILPLQRWLPEVSETPSAVILGLHGFGDYANAFDEAATALKDQGMVVYAYDQRGFGRTASRPFWPGTNSLVQDASDMLMLLRHHYPGVPLYLAGDSMGGAVAIATATTRPHLMDGVILVAPALWGTTDMPWYQTTPLSVLSHSLPWLPLSGAGLDIWPSDNIDMLRRLSQDPHMMKSVRVDMVAGLTRLMDQARGRARDLGNVFGQEYGGRIMVLSGAKDQVIPPDSIAGFVRDIRSSPLLAGAVALSDNVTFCIYPDGYHMLLRDLGGPIVIDDIGDWILKPDSFGTGSHVAHLSCRSW
ncbi:MAG: lysophospholipase [Pseudomonadota bacterium]